MTYIGAVVDRFATGSIDTGLWSASAGTVSVVGGRGRVQSDTGFGRLVTGLSYVLGGSSTHAKVWPAPSGTASQTFTQYVVLSLTGGTDLTISHDAVANSIGFLNRVAFDDAGGVYITYSATDHRWWKIRESGGTVYFETSPDGLTWTTQRSISTPAWVGSESGSQGVQYLTHRNTAEGVPANFYAEIDEVGVVAGTATTLLRIHPSAVGDSDAIEYPVPEPSSRWQILTGPASGGYAQELTAAQDRKLTMRLKDPSELAFGIDGRNHEALSIDELTTDAHVRWTSKTGVVWNLFRGRIGGSSDTLDADSHKMSVTALDYRALLTRRRLYAGRGINANDSFEDGLGHWTGAGGTLELDDGQHSDRLKSGRITPDGVTGTTSITSDNFPASAGTAYRLSGSMRCVTGRTVTLEVIWKNGGGGTISTSSITVTLEAETWRRVDEDAVAPVGTTQFAIVFLTTGTAPATDIMWLDDAKLTTYPTLASRLVYSDVEQVDIAWDMVNDTQSRVGGDLGISNASTPTGELRDRLYAVGDSVGDRIKELGEVQGGFDWDIVPISASALQFVTWHEDRGVSRGVVLEFDGPVVSAQRQVTATEYANALRFTGADTTIPNEKEADDLGTAPQGRFDAVFADTGLTTQDALDGRAHWQLKQSQTVRPTWSVRLRRGYWRGPDHIWLGDPVRLVVYSGRLQVDTILRVHEISFAIDGDGGEDIELTLNGPKIDYRRPPAIADRRLTNLERR